MPLKQSSRKFSKSSFESKPRSSESDALKDAETTSGSPLCALEGSGVATQQGIINNLNAYLDAEEEQHLAKAVGLSQLPKSPAHLISLSNPKKRRVRFANIIEKVGDKGYSLILRYLKSIRTRICIMGNGGAGVAGFVYLLANETILANVTLVWHGGNSDVNFKNAFALHIGLTYEPHIEREFIRNLGGSLEKDICTLFINKLKIFIPDGDPLGLRKSISKSSPKQRNPHSIIGGALVKSFLHGHTVKKKALGRYASRYNHSAIGEHDKMMLTAGAKEIVTSHRSLDLGMGCPRQSDKVERFSHLLGQTAVIANQTWYPPSLLDYSMKNGCYHLNDESFLCDAIRKGLIVSSNILEEPWLNNPCQMWQQPHNRSKASEKVFAFLRGNHEFIEKFNSKITVDNRIPIYPPDPSRDYIQEYLAAQYKLQSTAPIRFLEEWSFMNYEATMYAQIVQKGGTFETISETFRERLNELVDQRTTAQHI